MKVRWMAAGMAGVIGAVLVAGVLFADSDGQGTGPLDDVRDRVARILGIERSTLDDAYSQARDEIRDEKRNERLAELIEEGLITQEQADQIAAWQDARPEVLDEIGPRLELGQEAMPFQDHMDKLVPGVPRAHMPIPSAEQIEALLDSAVENGRITEEDAADIAAWLETRPEALEKLFTPAPALDGRLFGGRGHFPEGRWEFKFRGPRGEFEGAVPVPPQFREMPGGFGLHMRPGIAPEDFDFDDLEEIFPGFGEWAPRMFERPPATENSGAEA